jgi:hypothetical protein
MPQVKKLTMNRKTKIILILIPMIATITGCYYDSEERLYPKYYDPCSDKVVTFSKTVTTILQPCQICHSNSAASSSGSGIKLQDYTDVMTQVINGKLMGSIKHASGYVSMPNGGGKLPDCEIKKLQEWIDSGSPNN